MTFQQLHYILEVSRTGSVTKAAENLFVSRSGVSFSIRALEEELGYSVFVRTSSGLVPTNKGAMVLECARQICKTQQRLTDIGEETKNRVRLILPAYYPAEVAMHRLLQEYPSVSFTAQSYYADLHRCLSAGELELAVRCTFEEPAVDPADGIAVRELGRIPVAVLLGPGHRLYQKENITAEDFRGEVLIDSPTKTLSRCPVLRKSLPFDPEQSFLTNITTIREKLLVEGKGFTVRKAPPKDLLKKDSYRYFWLEGVYQHLYCMRSIDRTLAPEAERYLTLLYEELENYQQPDIKETIKPAWLLQITE